LSQNEEEEEGDVCHLKFARFDAGYGSKEVNADEEAVNADEEAVKVKSDVLEHIAAVNAELATITNIKAILNEAARLAKKSGKKNKIELKSYFNSLDDGVVKKEGLEVAESNPSAIVNWKAAEFIGLALGNIISHFRALKLPSRDHFKHAHGEVSAHRLAVVLQALRDLTAKTCLRGDLQDLKQFQEFQDTCLKLKLRVPSTNTKPEVSEIETEEVENEDQFTNTLFDAVKSVDESAHDWVNSDWSKSTNSAEPTKPSTFLATTPLENFPYKEKSVCPSLGTKNQAYPPCSFNEGTKEKSLKYCQYHVPVSQCVTFSN
jgi:hypothetical protein